MAAKKKFSLEESIIELRGILSNMQSPNSDFDENLKLFQKGSVLIEKCRNYLDESEFLVKKILEKGDE